MHIHLWVYVPFQMQLMRQDGDDSAADVVERRNLR
jgi:hypothetical protein